MIGAGRRENVPVSGSVDYHLSENRLASLFTLKGHSNYSVAFHQRPAAPGVKAECDARLYHHIVQDALQHFRIHIGGQPYLSVHHKKTVASPSFNEFGIGRSYGIMRGLDDAVQRLQPIQPLFLLPCDDV